MCVDASKFAHILTKKPYCLFSVAGNTTTIISWLSFSSVRYQTFLHKYNVHSLHSLLVSPQFRRSLDCEQAASRLPTSNRWGCTTWQQHNEVDEHLIESKTYFSIFLLVLIFRNSVAPTFAGAELTQAGGQGQASVALPPAASWSREIECSLQSGRCSGKNGVAFLMRGKKYMLRHYFTYA